MITIWVIEAIVEIDGDSVHQTGDKAFISRENAEAYRKEVQTREGVKFTRLHEVELADGSDRAGITRKLDEVKNHFTNKHEQTIFLRKLLRE